MKTFVGSLVPIPVLLVVSVAACGQTGPALNVANVQNAVDQLLGSVKRGGSVVVEGIQENNANAATAVIRFDAFSYHFESNPVFKDQTFSGKGAGELIHYNDGRWVLNSVAWGYGDRVQGTVEIVATTKSSKPADEGVTSGYTGFTDALAETKLPEIRAALLRAKRIATTQTTVKVISVCEPGRANERDRVSVGVLYQRDGKWYVSFVKFNRTLRGWTSDGLADIEVPSGPNQTGIC